MTPLLLASTLDAIAVSQCLGAWLRHDATEDAHRRLRQIETGKPLRNARALRRLEHGAARLDLERNDLLPLRQRVGDLDLHNTGTHRLTPP